MISFLEAAQHYASLGWRVFPVKPRDKVPIVKGGFKVATVSQAQIMRWWSRWPDANVGIATGLDSGLLVIDLDSPCAREAWTRIYRERANGTPFPAAAVVVTARGFHIYLALDPGNTVACSTGQGDEKGIDVRGDGGYVLAPPSIHPSGHVYRWDLALLDGSRHPPLFSAASWNETPGTAMRA